VKNLTRTEAAPPYTNGAGPYYVDAKKEKDIEVDWKSVVSEESLTSSVKKPEAVKA
jgi:hypothetical protein